jgi:3-deoxy-D-manno-octulosonate 8-phosphate phosphatase KdsC-like HAD superfamily phosphatase
MRRFIWWRLRRRLAAMEVVVLDVDGVLTDGASGTGRKVS